MILVALLEKSSVVSCGFSSSSLSLCLGYVCFDVVIRDTRKDLRFVVSRKIRSFSCDPKVSLPQLTADDVDGKRLLDFSRCSGQFNGSCFAVHLRDLLQISSSSSTTTTPTQISLLRTTVSYGSSFLATLQNKLVQPVNEGLGIRTIASTITSTTTTSGHSQSGLESER